MGLLCLIPGLILVATDGWFQDQHTVGWILTGIGAALLAIQFVILLVAGLAVNKQRKDFSSRW